ncbi:hypothetical protein CHL76_02210 [Marinococcus halophilus]|uniref:Uncharacterized protein n=1 Tax=Marinococcus halophilus TaxID=1371 RepID=A0A510Y1R2_MARHA|nr:hypothetical protein [Marinococcus halophilus]OZT81190.1 hypothetical protein CHL76_02210 [Marinococcus halophilus]GEK57123.1 hypothetical protein MHA01_00280 [Marinococcus halophilus]
MKVKFIQVDKNEKFVHKGKPIKVGDTIDLPEHRAKDFIARGKAEEVKTQEKKKEPQEKTKE